MTPREHALTVQGWMNPEELDWLTFRASTAHRVLEVGAWKGRSTIVLAASTPGTVDVVDPYISEDPILAAELRREGPEGLRRQFWQNTKPWREKIWMWTSAWRLLETQPDPYDFIFIAWEHD